MVSAQWNATGEVVPDLNTPVLKFFDEASVEHVDQSKRAMTLRDLLTMSDGLLWNETFPTTTPSTRSLSWHSSIIGSSTHSTRPWHVSRSVFNYNSGATLILGHIFRIATGVDIEEYAVKHLFTPLGIADYYWDRTPFGLTDTQEGLTLTRSLAKIAQLFLKRVAGEMRKSSRPHGYRNRPHRIMRLAQRGRGLWLPLVSHPYTFEEQNLMAYFGKGFGGQRPVFLPELDLVIVLTGWNILPEQLFTAMEAVERVTAALSED